MLKVTTHEALTALADSCPDDEHMLMMLARVALDFGDARLCQRLLVRARELAVAEQRPELATSFAYLANHFFRIGDATSARLNLERSLRINPADGYAREQLRRLARGA